MELGAPTLVQIHLVMCGNTKAALCVPRVDGASDLAGKAQAVNRRSADPELPRNSVLGNRCYCPFSAPSLGEGTVTPAGRTAYSPYSIVKTAVPKTRTLVSLSFDSGSQKSPILW